eukprot:12122860-Heterocapsa_arctica.AAC.1
MVTGSYTLHRTPTDAFLARLPVLRWRAVVAYDVFECLHNGLGIGCRDGHGAWTLDHARGTVAHFRH